MNILQMSKYGTSRMVWLYCIKRRLLLTPLFLLHFRSDFLSLPFQAIECNLAGVGPKGIFHRDTCIFRYCTAFVWLCLSLQRTHGPRLPWRTLSGWHTVPCGDLFRPNYAATLTLRSSHGPASSSTTALRGGWVHSVVVVIHTLL